MPFACFSPRPDTFATLPRGVTLTDPHNAALLSRRTSHRPQAHPDPRAVSSAVTTHDVLCETEMGMGGGKEEELYKRRMRRVSKATVGTPQEFVHRAHVGVEDIRRVSQDRGSLADISSAFAGKQTNIRAPVPIRTAAPASPVLSVASPSPTTTGSHSPQSIVRPPSRPLSPVVAFPPLPLSRGQSFDSSAVEEGTAFGGRSRSPPPEVITRPLSPVLLPTREFKISDHKVKRKAAPVFVPSKILERKEPGADSGGEEGKKTEDKEKIELPVPLDDRGRPMHFVGGHYMTNTTKFKFDDALDAISKALG